MLIIIGMSIAFILGAYVRAPFKFRRAKTKERLEEVRDTRPNEIEDERGKLERQLSDLLNYGRDGDSDNV